MNTAHKLPVEAKTISSAFAKGFDELNVGNELIANAKRDRQASANWNSTPKRSVAASNTPNGPK